MPPWPPHLYRQAAQRLGIQPEVIENAIRLSNSSRLQHGLPQILTLRHLAMCTNVSYQFLRYVAARGSARLYRCFRLSKRSGGYRQICVPNPCLLRVQRWIVRYLLSRLTPHPASYAYSRNRSSVMCARMHCGAKWLIKIDVRQFFESISERQVYRVFTDLGYQPLVALELTRICTRPSFSIDRFMRHRWNNRFNGTRYTIEQYHSVLVGSLPQGAPTSPMLSNLAVWDLDEALNCYAMNRGIVYTRYADDLMFSTSSTEFSRASAEEVVRFVYRTLGRHALQPHFAKTHISPPGARKVVLGMLVDRDRPRLTREYRERLEIHIHSLETNGPLIHRERRAFDSLGGMKAHIWGLLTHAEHVDPAFACPLVARFLQIDWPV